MHINESGTISLTYGGITVYVATDEHEYEAEIEAFIEGMTITNKGSSLYLTYSEYSISNVLIFSK